LSLEYRRRHDSICRQEMRIAERNDSAPFHPD
jgi:hypothetical protein